MLKHFRTAINYCLVLMALSMIAVGACNKADPPTAPGSGIDNGDLKYTIDGLSDMTMERTGQVVKSITITKLSGRLENVALTCVGLPAGATAKFSPISIGLPSFATIFTLKCVRAPVGVYDIVVRGSSQSSGYTEVKLKLTVLPYANAADGVVGRYREEGLCTQTGGIGDTVNVQRVDATPNRVNIQGFWSGVWSNEVYADLDVATGTINVPVQTTNGVSFSGSGTFDDNTLIIKYRVTGSTVDDTCTSTFSRVY